MSLQELFDKDAVKRQIESYLELGFHPIPLRGKVARYQWKQFSLTSANLNRHLAPHINWGLRTDRLEGGLWFYVIDVDRRELLASVIDHCPGLIDAPIVATGRGFHIYLTWKEEVRTRRLDKVEVIGNGYVVAPPSIHPDSGKRYRFIKPLKGIPPLMDPQDVIAQEWGTRPPSMVSKPPGRPAPIGPMPMLHEIIQNGVDEGQRHSALVRYLGALFNTQMTEEEALEIVLEWNKLNRPPMPDREVIETTRDCYRRFEEKAQEELRRQMSRGDKPGQTDSGSQT